MKILTWDIETSYIVGAVWHLGEQRLNHQQILEDWNLLSAAWKWIDSPKVEVAAVPYSRPTDDKELVRCLHKVLSEADVIVAHNGDKFDLKKFNTRAIFHGFPPIPPIPTIDTLKVARQLFAFSSNRLDYLGQFLGIGRKIETGGLNLWLQVMSGSKKALQKMVRYNKGDVLLLEEVYKKLRPYMKSHPNHQRHSGVKCCPNCGSKKFTRSGQRHTQTHSYWRYVCSAPGCRAWFKGERVK